MPKAGMDGLAVGWLRGGRAGSSSKSDELSILRCLQLERRTEVKKFDQYTRPGSHVLFE